MMALALDHIWQSTLFAAGAGFVTLFLRANSASVRYRIWLLASLKFLFPLVLLTQAGRSLSFLLPAVPAPPSIMGTLADTAQPFSDGIGLSVPAAASWNWNIILATLWLAGFIATAFIWAHQWRQLQKIVRSAIPFPSSAPLPVRMSPSQMEPAVVGVFSCVLILPAGIASRLSHAELEAIICHETCHWRRRDNLTGALHMAVETIFWFHPLLWWLQSRLVAERERACDEEVLAAGRDPQVYAEGILKICKSYVQSPLQCAPGVSGADLRRRIERIMDGAIGVRLGALKRGLLALCAAAMVAAPLAIGIFAAPPVLGDTAGKPHPGTQAALRRHIENIERGHEDFAALVPRLALTERAGEANLQATIRQWGALRSITFRGNENGNDVYHVAFANQLVAWTIGRLQPDGRIGPALFYRAAFKRNENKPSPGLEKAIRLMLEADARSKQAYEIMTPALRVTRDRQWSQLRVAAEKLGAIRSLAFQGVDMNGWDIYTATFANGTATVTAAPLQGGKLDWVSRTAILLPGAAAHADRRPLLRQFVEGGLKGIYPFQSMSPLLAAVVVQSQDSASEIDAKAGAFQSMTFVGGDPFGVDVYRVVCEHSAFEYRVGPLTPDGKLNGVGRRPLI